MTPVQKLSAKSKKSWRARKQQASTIKIIMTALDALQRTIAPLDLADLLPSLIPKKVVIPRMMFDAAVRALNVSKDASAITMEGITYVPSQMLPIIKRKRKRS